MSFENWIALIGLVSGVIGTIIIFFIKQSNKIATIEARIDQFESDLKLHETLNERSIDKISGEMKDLSKVISEMSTKIDTIIGFLKGKDFNV